MGGRYYSIISKLRIKALPHYSFNNSVLGIRT